MNPKSCLGIKWKSRAFWGGRRIDVIYIMAKKEKFNGKDGSRDSKSLEYMPAELSVKEI